MCSESNNGIQSWQRHMFKLNFHRIERWPTVPWVCPPRPYLVEGQQSSESVHLGLTLLRASSPLSLSTSALPCWGPAVPWVCPPRPYLVEGQQSPESVHLGLTLLRASSPLGLSTSALPCWGPAVPWVCPPRPYLVEGQQSPGSVHLGLTLLRASSPLSLSTSACSSTTIRDPGSSLTTGVLTMALARSAYRSVLKVSL